MRAMGRRAKVIRLPGPLAAGEPPGSGLVEVLRCRDQGEALVVRSLLDSEGIAAVLRGQLVQSVHPFSVGDQGEVTVFVPAADAEAARRILSR